jgi:AcrR family transcriptional regulator
MSTRDDILAAALRIFTEAGSRGATTRRIAAEAGVNEITLFRHFGSKELLLREALRFAGAGANVAGLPESPTDPAAELAWWCARQLDGLHAVRDLLRTAMAEQHSTPGAGEVACEVPSRMAAELAAYIRRLQAAGGADPEVDADGASSMLVGALFTDAVTRDLMQARYPVPRVTAAALYAGLLLRALAASGGGSPSSREGPAAAGGTPGVDPDGRPAREDGSPSGSGDDQPDLWGGLL